MFPVYTSGEAFPGVEIDRQIVDRRRRNMREKRLVSGSRMMPSAAMLVDLYIPPEQPAGQHGRPTQLLPRLLGTLERAYSTPIGFSYAAGYFREFSCNRSDLC